MRVNVKLKALMAMVCDTHYNRRHDSEPYAGHLQTVVFGTYSGATAVYECDNRGTDVWNRNRNGVLKYAYYNLHGYRIF